MPRRSWLFAAVHALLAVVCTAAIALAMGAVWLAVTLHVPTAIWWFALPTGLVLGYTIRAWATRSRFAAMPLAAAGTLLAALYMQCLLVGLRLAAVFGLDYFLTLRTAGPGMLLALARASLDNRVLVSCAVGAVLALLVAARSPRRGHITHRAP